MGVASRCCLLAASIPVVVGLTAYAYIQAYMPTFELRPSEADPEKTMAAVCYERHGDSSVLQVRTDYPRPVLSPGQILVNVRFASLNPCDFKFRRNHVPGFVSPKPKIPGGDIAGVVVAVGSEVPAERFKVGDRVAALLPLLGARWGGYAQFAAVNQEFAALVPDNVTLEKAAAIPLVALTALQGLDKLRRPLAGKRILVQAGAGGVGSFAVQWAAKVLGMQVATTCSERNVEFVRALGADTVIDYGKQAFDTELRDLDAVLDAMSYMFEERTIASAMLNPVSGHYLNIVGSDWSLGVHGQEKGNGLTTWMNLARFKISRLLFGKGRDYDVVAVNPNGAQLQEVLDRMATSEIDVTIDRTFPLEQAAKAQDLLAEGHTRGKLILKMPAASK